MKNAGTHRLALLAALLSPLPCLAEISDKAASIEQLWVQAIVLGLIGLVAGRWRFLAGLLIFVLDLILAWGAWEMISDSHIGPSLGSTYVFVAIASSIVMLSLTAIGMWLGWRRNGFLGE